MTKYRTCPRCRSEFVCWNWIYCRTFKTFWANLIRGLPCVWKRPWIFITERHTHECWNCTRCFNTMFKVRNGMSYEMLNETFKYLPKHELRDAIHELEYLFHDGYKVWIQDHCKHRLNIALNEIKRIVETKINEEGAEPPDDIVSILERQDNEEKAKEASTIAV